MSVRSLVLAALLAPAVAPAAELDLARTGGVALGGGTVAGSARSRVKVDWGTTEAPSDADVDDADWVEDVRLRTDAVALEGLATALWFRYEKDVDGTAPDSPFVDQRDAYGGRDDLKLFEGWAAYGGPGLLPGDAEVRGGRQLRYLVESLHYDGGEVLVPTPWEGEALALVGRRVTFESDPDERLIAAGSWSFRPAEWTRVEIADAYYDQNQLELLVHQELSEEWDATADLVLLEAELRELSLSAFWVGFGEGGFEGRDATLFASWLWKAASGLDDFRLDATSGLALPDDPRERERLFLRPLPSFHEWLADGSWTFARLAGRRLGATGSVLGRLFTEGDAESVVDSDTVAVTLGAYVLDLVALGDLGGADVSFFATREEIFLADIPPDLDEEDLADTTGEGETGYFELAGEVRARALTSRLQGVVRLGYRFYDEARTRFLVADQLDGLDVTAYLRYRWDDHLRFTAGYGYLEDLVVRFGDVAAVATSDLPTTYPDLAQVQTAFLDVTFSF